jgi:colanic acid biosynthesis protein WcaH
MEIHDEYVPEETFGACLAHLPQVCVEVVLAHDGGVVLARRTNEPAAGEWFWPGGRLYKGEHLDDAAERIAREELGLPVDIERRLGVHAHFWDTASVTGAASRHTVNVVFLVSPTDSLDISLDSQHDDWKLVHSVDERYHEYVRLYVERHGLL